VDAIVEGPNLEFSTETREELLYDKQKARAESCWTLDACHCISCRATAPLCMHCHEAAKHLQLGEE
jgi:hypothetical protein